MLNALLASICRLRFRHLTQSSLLGADMWSIKFTSYTSKWCSELSLLQSQACWAKITQALFKNRVFNKNRFFFSDFICLTSYSLTFPEPKNILSKVFVFKVYQNLTWKRTWLENLTRTHYTPSGQRCSAIPSSSLCSSCFRLVFLPQIASRQVRFHTTEQFPNHKATYTLTFWRISLGLWCCGSSTTKKCSRS